MKKLMSKRKLKTIKPTEEADRASREKTMEPIGDGDSGPFIQSILARKESTTLLLRIWNRYDIKIDSKDVYLRRDKCEPFKLFSPLVLCSVKKLPNKDYFLLVSPKKKIFIRKEHNSHCLHDYILTRINSVHQTHFNMESQVERYSTIRAKPRLLTKDLAAIKQHSGNELCADCGEPNPLWASVSFFVTLCIKCSGAHRALGVSVSRVRSLEMDTWPSNISLLFFNLGNAIVNKIYAFGVCEKIQQQLREGKIGREDFALDKYVNRKFLLPLSRMDQLGGDIHSDDSFLSLGDQSPNQNIIHSDQSESNVLHRNYDRLSENLVRYAEKGNIVHCVFFVAHGVDVNYRNSQGLTPLLVATKNDWRNLVYYLLLNGADPNITDYDGNAPIHIASLNNDSYICCLLINFKTDLDLKNKNDMTALMVAEANLCVDVIVVLKVAQLNANMKGAPKNDTLDWVLHDMAKDEFAFLTSGFKDHN